MLNFNFTQPTEILFGKGQMDHVGDAAKKHGATKVLIVYGSERIKINGMFEKVTSSLRSAGLEHSEIGGIEPNPRLSSVNKGIEVAKRDKCDFILAVGGGSVIDAAKAISMGIKYDGDVWDFFLRKATPMDAVPVASILTLAATGSEMNSGTVVTNWETQDKLPAGSPLVLPKFSILDPENTYTVNEWQTASGTADIMSHILEQYFSPIGGTHIQDRMCEAMLKTAMHYGPIAIKEPENYEARANLMWTGTLALNGLLSTGRYGDWAVHMIEHAVSAIYDVTHGAGLALITPYWMEYTMTEKNVEKYYNFAVNVMGVPANEDKIIAAKEGISKLRAFFKAMGLPTKLSDFDIDDSRIEEMADKATKFGMIGQFRKLDRDDVLEIFKMMI